ncbi:MAG TPA: tetratricopeptide repeat protein [Micropepsaceae bacterium]|jgi:predicted O-linked N-acetylglucosamine transferase (SPINDLY family)|nr:tetratricopeptide repeat protein [Micropepsaceae bacterium]
MNESVLQNAADLRRAGRFAEAAQLYARLLQEQPRHFEALHALGLLHYQSGRIEEAERLVGEAVLVNPSHAEALYNRASLLLKLNRLEDALASFSRALAVRPDYAEALGNRGGALLRMGRAAEGIRDFERLAALRPNLPQAWVNLGGAQLVLNRPIEALASYERALALDSKNAEALYRRADLFLYFKRYAEAAAAYEAFLAVAPNHAQAWSMRGVALVELRRQAEALTCFDRAVALDPANVDARNNRANVLFELKRFEEAGRDFERALQLAPDLPYVEGFLIQCRIRVCDWRHLDEDRRNLSEGLRAWKRIIDPQGNLPISRSPEDQLQCARIFMADEAAGPPLWHGERYSHDRIRVAYLTADFRPHPVAFLIAGLFEQHDKSRFQTIGISFGPGVESDIHRRIAASFEHFHDVRLMGDGDVAAMLKRMEVDVAVDLMAFTEGCRPGILGYRPAPVQANFLGFPGTSGADHIDYILADRIIIPDEARHFYSEQVVYLPDTYQANDSKRAIAAEMPVRQSLGLPENGFVFCCFNNNYKIMPEIFAIWMRLLAKVEDSVLWLLEDNAAAAANLHKQAEACGIAKERLIFAPRTTPPEHLARQRLADLFLDTSPYTAHTTCSDALWAGLPVVTFLGPTFAARVAGSVLNAAGLSELVTASPAEYEELALKLARDRPALAAVKAKLAANRDRCALFDTAQFARNLERAFTHMVERQRQGLAPESFAVDSIP